MQIVKILNNNVAIVDDGNNREKIVSGKGIAFSKKVGDRIDTSKIEKQFVLIDESMEQSQRKLYNEVSEIAEWIVTKAKEKLSVSLNENIYPALIDHISFAINRFHQGLILKNDMLWEIRRMYPAEYKISKEAFSLINQRFEISLPEDEIAFLTLHIVSAQLNRKVPQIVQITKMVQDIVNIITHHFYIDFNQESVAFNRLITHLQFFASRYVSDEQYLHDADEQLFETLTHRYQQSFACVKKIQKYMKNIHQKKITKDEMMYLTIHIERIITKDEE